MSKITIEVEDFEGQVAVNVQVEGWDKDSSAVHLAERALEHIDSLAQVVAEPKRKVLTAGEISARKRWKPPAEIILPH